MIHRSGALAALVAAALLLTGCTAADSGKGSATPTATPTPEPVVAGDGSLQIATVLDMAGKKASVSQAQVAGVELAARELNEQGGVLGAPVVVLHRSTATDAATLATELEDRAIDVVLWSATGDIPEEITALGGATTVVRIGPADWKPDKAFAARLRSADPGTSLAGGGEAYDTTMRVALAATVADNDSGSAIAADITTVSSGSFSCVSFGECAAALADDATISYAGVTGSGGLAQATPEAEPTPAKTKKK
ncbi:ABC transporter substrate-binding protein [Leifsonia sp. Leaf264]|uniref:ABC transporter substrate-binding protein n=1 Tax=Leifsonia sp. Leaf264 TaxID=1736314 RepID=UPI00070083A5|nr:hypothetical protein ASF30_12835 [Leifsonia sp. Leaf264]